MGEKFKVTAAGLVRPVVLSADPTAPPEGFFYYNTVSNMYRYYDGAVWHDLGTANPNLQQVTTTGNETTNNIVFKGTAKLDLSQTTSATIIPVKMYEQAGEPALAADDLVALWWKTDTSQLFLICRKAGTIKSVELS